MSQSINSPVNNWLSRIRTSLRARVAFGVGLPVLLALSLLSLTHYLRERQLLEDQIELTSSQMGGLTLGGLQHAMLVNDQEDLEQIVHDVGAMENVERVQIVDLNGEVKSDSSGREIGKVYQSQSLGCIECHQGSAENRPRTTRLTTTESTLRISTPITNDESCWECHGRSDTHLGMVILDVSLIDAEAQVLKDLRADLTISVISTLVITAAVYLLIHWLVVRRVEAFQDPLAQFATGDHTARLPSGEGPTDELGQLAKTFNKMADELQLQEKEQALQAEIKQRAIREERERIGRELHDGLAQLLGYVNTKATAVRLMLKKNKLNVAQQQLKQLEEAAQELFVDVREAILGLRMNNGSLSLVEAIQEYSDRFSRLSEIDVEVLVDPLSPEWDFDAETELQLLRIVQEALTNIRKHAHTKNAWIALKENSGNLTLTVGDKGVGFDPTEDREIKKRPHFGLGTMQERAEAIGARFSVDSDLGSGTRIEIELDRNGE
jgi:signal transduction histidine kinase